MSASPTSPNNRKRQQASGLSQPQAIVPAPPAAVASSSSPAPAPALAQNASTAPLSPPKARSPGVSVPTSINTEAANKAVDTIARSPLSPTSTRKRKASEMAAASEPAPTAADPVSGQVSGGPAKLATEPTAITATPATEPSQTQPAPPVKKSRTNTPWTPAEERKLKTLRDAGSSWGEIAKEFPHRTEGSVKKHWYKDMHYADFAEDESAALLAAIREYEANKWKEIGKKVGKPAKACEQYAKEHFSGKL